MFESGTVQEQVLERAVKDESFRQEVLNNPRAVLAREYNVHIPETVSIRVVEDAANTLTIALPPKQESLQELSDAELGAAAGGQLVIGNTFICTFGKGACVKPH
ncbi:MAG TPA: NHLP leader peptide family RiPP precursor [Ktedonobacterales bacterium]|jgi:hypothetical protein